MGRIIFLNCYARDVVSGGIKTMYQHAALLQEAGFTAQVLQEGVPLWLDQRLASLTCKTISDLCDEDVLVFPETLREWYAEMIRAPLKGRKVIFCQSPHYFFTYAPSRQALREWGVQQVLAPGQRASRMVQTVLGLDEVPVTPPAVDGNVFRPRAKKLQIAVSYSKWPQQGPYPQYAGLIRDILKLKYPRYAEIEWLPLQGMKEGEMAGVLGDSAVCLSLARLEALGMIALEAMAAGCLVVGFHGGGGLDYATPQNGFWHSPEDLEGVADSLAMALSGVETQAPAITGMMEQGRRTVRAYGPSRIRHRLQQVYGRFFGGMTDGTGKKI